MSSILDLIAKVWESLVLRDVEKCLIKIQLKIILSIMSVQNSEGDAKTVGKVLNLISSEIINATFKNIVYF